MRDRTAQQSPFLSPAFVLPPYLLDRVARHGNARLRALASDTLALDQHMRGLRAGMPRVSSISAQARASSPGQVQRAVYSAEQGNQLPGTLVRGEGQPASGDPAVDEAYEYLGATYALFWEVYQRHSIDGAGLPLIGTVHYGQGYENAFWNGEQMVFGDGDGEIFNRFTIAVDIVGHELAHGVIEHEAGLIYQNQAGALNESLSDVFGSLVKQYRLKQNAEEADWLIGAGLFTSAVKARALRSMAEPGSAYDDPVLGKDPQPGHMKDFVDTHIDNGGVHINSGIPNRAFYLTATALGGPAWEKAGRVWYDTLRDERLGSNADFAAFARLTLDNAAKLFGANSTEQQAVKAGWDGVGVTT
ncbi:M4 family metallopeptidase [Pseudomonas indica]|uniref:M4 family metallopeptidase n=1 Tax=Pseudomonas indica TaxID=137658 RepID=UPI000BAB9483|nr:M4 family metallopeptidase [Pseudomonas indica]PAU60142.1 peptidase M4 family protein [Pseudomonas indica]